MPTRAKSSTSKTSSSPRVSIPTRTVTLKIPENPVLVTVVALMIVSFLVGVLITNIVYKVNGGQLSLGSNSATTATTAGASPTAAAQIVKPLGIAKAIGIDADQFKSCVQSKKYANKVTQDFTLGGQAGVTGTPATFINGNLISGAVPWATFKTAIDQELADPTSPLPSTTPTTVDVSQGPFPAMGDTNAPVTVVEFADFQCPFCEQWFQQIEPNLISDYVNTGKVRFIFQNYAFLGPDSTTAAEAAYCANDQGKFWAYHDFMYKNQGQEDSGWASESNIVN